MPRYVLETRIEEYGYTIDIPDGWIEEEGHIQSVPGGEMYIREADLPAGTSLDQFAESIRDSAREELWPSATLFEISSFERKRYQDQESYLLEYRVQLDPKYCVVDVVELIALGTSLPGPTGGFQVRHQACDWQVDGELDRARREALESFRIVEIPSDYYTQFISARGVTIRATGKVDPAALHEAAEIMTVMLDGRQDVQDCMAVSGSALAIVPVDDPVTKLPEFAYLKGKSDMWGQSYDGTNTPGLGGDPVSATSERKLLGDPGYPVYRDVHEPAHHIDGQCFTESDKQLWTDIHRRAVDRVLSVFGFDVYPFSQGLMVDHGEFFAGLTQYYFYQHDVPRMYAEQFFPEAFEFLEEFYGVLTSSEADRPGFVQYVTSSGIPLPWLVPGGLTYEHGTLGYSIDLLPGWEVERESVDGLLLAGRNWPRPQIRIEYTPLPDGSDTEAELARLAESSIREWEQLTGTWNMSEVPLFERESLDGKVSYWIRFQGVESPASCNVDNIQRVLTATLGGRSYGVVLKGSTCGDRGEFALRDLETMFRSFRLPASVSTPAMTPTPGSE